MASYRSVFDNRKKKFGLSGAWLKSLALLSMTIDHFAVIIIQNGKLYGYEPEYYEMAIATPLGQQWLQVYEICRILGRIAFPIFAFFLVEGFLKTSDFWRYLGRVLLMAVFTEPIYDLALSNELFSVEHQNVGWTFFVALLMLYSMKRLRKHGVLKWLPVFVCGALAEALKLDYGGLAILSVALIYVFRKEKGLRMVSGAVTAGLNSLEWYGVGALAYLFLFFYNGERGRFHSRWLFYWYFPLHLLVMYGMIYIGAMFS